MSHLVPPVHGLGLFLGPGKAQYINTCLGVVTAALVCMCVNVYFRKR